MRFPFLFIFASLVLGTLFLVMLMSAVRSELALLLDKKRDDYHLPQG
jgi:hypothetical protein